MAKAQRKPSDDVASHQGMRAVDVVRKRYMGERRCLVVQEWFDKDHYPKGLLMWFPPITGTIMEQAASREPKNDFERQLMLMVITATDEGGKPLFQMGDLHALREQGEWGVLQRIFDFMLSSWLTKEEAAKMIGEDPISGQSSPSPKDSEKPSASSAA